MEVTMRKEVRSEGGEGCSEQNSMCPIVWKLDDVALTVEILHNATPPLGVIHHQDLKIFLDDLNKCNSVFYVILP